MKFKKLVVLCAALGAFVGLTSCGGGSGSSKGGQEITMWVGKESVDFYKKAANQFLENNPDFGYSITVVAADTGTVGGSMISDNTACGDIVTIAHDNLGKLASKSLIKVLTDETLLAQIDADNPEAFKKVMRSTIKVGGESVEYVFGSPYISQSLFLLYNKQYVTEEQAKTFEGLQEAALALRETDTSKKGDIHGCTVVGTDGFNFSFTLLAKRKADGYTSLKIYEDLDIKNCYCQGDDTVAVARWAQQAFDNGTLVLPNDSGYEMMMKTHTTLGVVTGAWYYSSVVSAIGEQNVGIAPIPEFTLTEENVAETSVEAGTVMRGGTFADCKCFVINGASAKEKYAAEQKLITYLSSKEVQNQSFKEASNMPAYAGCEEYIESVKDEISENAYKLATVQSEMNSIGIAQPFVTTAFNNFYYQSGAPDLYKNMVDKPTADTVRFVRETLFRMEYVWKWGNGTLANLEIPEVLPGDTSVKAG